MTLYASTHLKRQLFNSSKSTYRPLNSRIQQLNIFVHLTTHEKLFLFSSILFGLTFTVSAHRATTSPTLTLQAMVADDSISSIRASFGVTKLVIKPFGFQASTGIPSLENRFCFGCARSVQHWYQETSYRWIQRWSRNASLGSLLQPGQKKEDAIYVRMGDLYGVSLGYGTLVNNYSNSPSFERRKFGINADVNFKGIVGVEGLYSDIKGANLLAVRPYIRPLRPTKIPIIKVWNWLLVCDWQRRQCR